MSKSHIKVICIESSDDTDDAITIDSNETVSVDTESDYSLDGFVIDMGACSSTMYLVSQYIDTLPDLTSDMDILMC